MKRHLLVLIFWSPTISLRQKLNERYEDISGMELYKQQTEQLHVEFRKKLNSKSNLLIIDLNDR